jgi:hypothetical protein
VCMSSASGMFTRVDVPLDLRLSADGERSNR